MASFIQLLVSGLATGAIYALIAVGFTLLWQTSQTINFAQGESVMLPAFFVLAAMSIGAPVGSRVSSAKIGLVFSDIVSDLREKSAYAIPTCRLCSQPAIVMPRRLLLRT